jgi:putative ABC transport system permease protein
VIDGRFALRSLRRTRGLTAVIVATLSIAVATISGLFSVVNTFYKPMPYRNAERIVAVGKSTKVPDDVFRRFVDLAGFEHVGRYAGVSQGLLVGTEARPVTVAIVDSGFFAVLNPDVVAGRLPTVSEMSKGDGIIILSNRLARAVFGAAETALGKSLRIDGALWRVTAVLSPNFTFPRKTEAWVSDVATGRAETMNGAVGLLKPGVSFERASAAVNLIRQQLRSEDPERYKKGSLVFVDQHALSEYQDDPFVRQLKVAVLAAACLLIVACSNVALLLIARGLARRDEMAVRAALGASRGRLVRQQLVECAILGTVSGAVALLVGTWATDLVVKRVLPIEKAPGWFIVGTDWRVVMFTVGVVACTVVLFGLWPARVATRLDLAGLLRAAHGATSHSPTAAGNVPVVVQLTLSFALFAGAATLLVGTRRLATMDRGFERTGLYEVRVTADSRRDTSAAFRTALYRGLASAMESPAIAAAVVGRFSTFGTRQFVPGVFLPQSPTPVYSATEPAFQNVVSSNYFRLIGQRVIAGRGFTAEDREGAAAVAVVSRAYALRAWQGIEPVGKILDLRPSRGDESRGPLKIRVIGVVSDVLEGTTNLVPRADVFFSDRQATLYSGGLVVRAPNSSSTTVKAIAVKSLDELGRTWPITVVSAEEWIAEQTKDPRVLAMVIGIFGAASLLLALLGVYGIVASAVEERRREIGIRMTVGATSTQVVTMIMQSGSKLAFVAICLGIALSTVVLRGIGYIVAVPVGILVQIVAVTTVTYVAVALAASFVPARRAAVVDPVVALRD